MNTAYLTDLATCLRETNDPTLGPTDAGVCAVALELVAALTAGRLDDAARAISDLRGRLALREGIEIAARQMAGAAA